MSLGSRSEPASSIAGTMAPSVGASSFTGVFAARGSIGWLSPPSDRAVGDPPSRARSRVKVVGRRRVRTGRCRPRAESGRGGSCLALCTAIASTRRESTSDLGRRPRPGQQHGERVGGDPRRADPRRARPRAARRARSRLARGVARPRRSAFEPHEQEHHRWSGCDRPCAGGARRSARTRAGSADRSPRRSWRARDGAVGPTPRSGTARGSSPCGIAPRTRWSSAPACIATAPSASRACLGDDHDGRRRVPCRATIRAARSAPARPARRPRRRRLVGAARRRVAAARTSNRSSSASSSAIAASSPTSTTVTASSMCPPGRWRDYPIRERCAAASAGSPARQDGLRRHGSATRSPRGRRSAASSGRRVRLAACPTFAPAPSPPPATAGSPASAGRDQATLSLLIGVGTAYGFVAYQQAGGAGRNVST